MTEPNTDTDETDRLLRLVRNQEKTIEYQRKIIEEMEQQREMLLEVGEFPDELIETYDTETDR